MVSRQCILARELKDIGNEKFDGSQAERQIRQYFPLSILHYTVFRKNLGAQVKSMT